MLYVEDVFERITCRLLSNDAKGFDNLANDQWRCRFIESVWNQIEGGRGLSTSQAKIVLDIIKNLETYLVEYGDATQADLNNMFKWPRYRKEPYQSIILPKEVRHIGSNLLVFRFKYNSEILKDIKNIVRKSTHMSPMFNQRFKVWIIPVFRSTMRDVRQLIREHRFSSDAATDRWLNMAKESYDKPSTVQIQDDVCVAKVHDNPIMALWMENALDAEPV
jgi:hypothetical protein